MDTGNGSSGMDDSGRLRSLHPPAGCEGFEIRWCAADNFSGFGEKWLSGCPTMASHIFVNLCKASTLSGIRSGLDTCGGSLEIDGISTAINPPAGPDDFELDNGRVIGDSSDFGNERLSGWPIMLSHFFMKLSESPALIRPVLDHIFINLAESPALSGTRSGLDTCNGSSEVDGSVLSTTVNPSAGPDGCELDNGRATNDSGLWKEWLSGWPMVLSHTFMNRSESSALSIARWVLGSCDGSLETEGGGFDDGRVADDSAGLGESIE